MASDLKTVHITLISSIAATYLAILADDEQLRVTRQTLVTREDSLRLTKLKFDYGATSELDFHVIRRNEEGRAVTMLVGRYRDRLRRQSDGRWVITNRTAVSVARPGEEGTDAEWQRAIQRMPDRIRERFRWS